MRRKGNRPTRPTLHFARRRGTRSTHRSCFRYSQDDSVCLPEVPMLAPITGESGNAVREVHLLPRLRRKLEGDLPNPVGSQQEVGSPSRGAFRSIGLLSMSSRAWLAPYEAAQLTKFEETMPSIVTLNSDSTATGANGVDRSTTFLPR